MARKPQTVEFSESQVQFYEAVSSVAQEAGFDPTELALAIEDRGWVGGNYALDGDTTIATRRLTILKARVFAILDAHASAAINLWNNYTLGFGMTYTATSNQSALDTFWQEPKNRSITSAEGQRKLNRRLLIDGELFLTIHDTDTDGILIRKVDATQIDSFVTNPEDSEEVWGFRRSIGMTPNDTTQVFRNWAYADQDLTGAKVMHKGTLIDLGENMHLVQDNVLMYHVPFNAIHQRGNSLLSAALPWMTALRNFMEDRISITRGLAQYIRKLSIKGGAKQIGQVATKLASQLGGGIPMPGMVPSLPGTANPSFDPRLNASRAAKTFLENEAATFSDMPRSTGAGDASSDYKTIRLLICSATGLSEHYFGDGSSGNLATATAMELPMLKQFQSHQKLWEDVWKDIFAIVINFADPQPIQVDVDFPPILQDDVQELTAAVINVCAEFPEMKQPELLMAILSTLGINSASDVMKRVEAQQEEQKANIAKGLNANGSVPIAQPTPVVIPAKPAQQKTAPGGQPIAATNAAEAAAQLAEYLEAERLDRESVE